jgi:hypothetical protein
MRQKNFKIITIDDAWKKLSVLSQLKLKNKIGFLLVLSAEIISGLRRSRCQHGSLVLCISADIAAALFLTKVKVLSSPVTTKIHLVSIETLQRRSL